MEPRKNLALWIILILILICSIVFFSFVVASVGIMQKTGDERSISRIEYNNGDLLTTLNAIVVKVSEQYLTVIEKNNTKNLIDVSISNIENFEFKKGQEICIYYRGTIAESFPAQISDVSKIEIVKDESNVKISEDVIRFCYSNRNNVSLAINEFDSFGISFTITDSNELPYEYSNMYYISKKSEPDYTFKKLTNISDISCEDTITPLAYNMPNMTDNNSINIVGKKIDWSPIYGKLSER